MVFENVMGSCNQLTNVARIIAISLPRFCEARRPELHTCGDKTQIWTCLL